MSKWSIFKIWITPRPGNVFSRRSDKASTIVNIATDIKQIMQRLGIEIEQKLL